MACFFLPMILRRKHRDKNSCKPLRNPNKKENRKKEGKQVMLEYAMLQQKGFNNFMLVQKASFTKICKKN